MGENENVDLMDCCDMGSCDCLLKNAKGYDIGSVSKGRINKMRYYRETLMRYATSKYNNYDYVIMYDFDISGIIYKDGLMTSFSSNDDWDAVFARGLQSLPNLISRKMVLYDPFPFIPDDLQFNHDLILNTANKRQNDLLKHKIGDNLVKCKSGFNGMAIYKMNALLDSGYMNNTNKYCEHVDLFEDMYNKGYDKVYYNPSMVLFIGQGGPDRINFVSETYNLHNRKLNS